MIKNVRCNGEIVTQIVDGSGTKLADLTAEVENESSYVLPTSTNAGGELVAGSTIAAGTYFTGAATVPSGGGWTPRVASGTMTVDRDWIRDVTITHNMGTENIIIFLFNPRAMSDYVSTGSGDDGDRADMWSVVFNPKTFFNSGSSVRYDFSAYNTATGDNGVLNVDWSSYYAGMGLHFRAPYSTTGTDIVCDGITKKEDVKWFTENECHISIGSPFMTGVTYYWFAYELPTFTSSQKLTIGTPATSEVPTHTVTFVADGVTVGTVTFAEGDTAVAEPDVPHKEHYTGVWQTYSLGTTDLTVEAVYTPITYTITFVDDGGNHAVTYTVLTADTVTAPTVTPRDGYTAAWPSWSVGYDNGQTVEAVYTPITLTGITAAYSGGTVAAGTTLDQLTGITVTATYSDGSTATLAAGDYTLSGTLTAGQDNTVTVTYQGKTATFTVTVAAEPAGVTETEIALTWTAGKLAYAIGGAATATNTTSDFAYAHSQRITMETGMTYKVVTGEISAMKAEKPTLGKWNYRIVFVDDDNIIRATTEIQAENADNVTVENIATDPTFVAGSDVSLATGFYVREYTAGSTGGNVGNPIVNGMTNLTHLYKVG